MFAVGTRVTSRPPHIYGPAARCKIAPPRRSGTKRFAVDAYASFFKCLLRCHVVWQYPALGRPFGIIQRREPRDVTRYCRLKPTKTLESGHFLVRWLQQGARHHRRCSALVANLYQGGRPTAGAGYRNGQDLLPTSTAVVTSRTSSSPIRAAPITAKRRKGSRSRLRSAECRNQAVGKAVEIAKRNINMRRIILSTDRNGSGSIGNIVPGRKAVKSAS